MLQLRARIPGHHIGEFYKVVLSLLGYQIGKGNRRASCVGFGKVVSFDELGLIVMEADKNCGLYLKSKSSLPQLFRKLLDNCCLEPSCHAGEHQKTAKFYCDIRYCVKI